MDLLWNGKCPQNKPWHGRKPRATQAHISSFIFTDNMHLQDHSSEETRFDKVWGDTHI